MNKKFSTLAVAAMLASAFTVNADPGDVVKKLEEGNNGKQYQLVAINGDGVADDQYLVLEKEKGNAYLRLKTTTDGYDLGSSLWCVNVTLENQGKNPIFDFINKAQQLVLDVTIGGYNNWDNDGASNVNADEAFVGGEVAGWEFAPVLGSDDVPMFNEETDYTGKQYSLRSYINSNEVATLVKGNDGKIHVAVYNAGDAIPWNAIKFILKEADCVTLSPEQFNTILNTRSKEDFVKLTFDKNYNNTDIVNPFSENELMAQKAAKSTANDEDASNGFVNLYRQNADGSKQYLRVDTAYTNDYGINFLKFAFSENNEPIAEETQIANQYNFRLNYHPTTDELFIQAEEARYLKDGETWWHQGKDKPLKTDEIEIVKWNDEVSTTDDTNCKYLHNWVKLQDLVKEQEIRIITLGDKLINTHISFGFGGCSDVKAEYTSVADGVYVIKNAQGQVLASPIYDNGEKAAKFVSVDEQDPQHMPAYQWVVLTNYTQEKSLPTSPVTITNREFPNLTSSMQLREKDGASYMYTLNATNSDPDAVNPDEYLVALASTDSLVFEKVDDAYVKDKYLGYKKITKDSLTVNKYTFNYWHPYASDKYIAKSSKDSTLTVLEGKDAFVVDTLAWLGNKAYSTVDVKYGYNPNNAKLDGKARISGLAQLVRTVYEMKDGGINDKDATIWKVNKNDQFNIGDNDYNKVEYGQTGNSYYVFFKENNHIDGKHYYALVNAVLNTDATGYVIGGHKAGVSDYDAAATLKNQVLEETRTSAFAIERDDTPLYRRFNSAALEGQAGDGVDTLRFYEKYRNEYLMIEANKNFMVEHIDFLGIDAQDKAQGGLAFIVDTAWVNRGAGHIKPQYLISIDRHDYDGVAGEPCTEAGPHIDESGHITDDPYECVHAHKAVPGFKRGKFLINFHNFADEDANMVNADDYKWAEYDRAGFKEAIIVKDTMYILRDEFKNLANEEIDLAKIASVEVEAQKAYSKENGNLNGFLNYRYELTGDNHKYVTWSMRFVDRSVAANEVEADRAFLFESMKRAGDNDIAPVKAAWLKMQNGCLVLSDYNSQFDEVVTGGDDALIFNVEHVCGDKVAVDNENIAVEGVSVVAGNGQVTIMGAAGKNVTITNILGKVIASQVIASDNATIAVSIIN